MVLAAVLAVAGCADRNNIDNYPEEIERLKEKFVRLKVFPEQIPSSAKSTHYLIDEGGMGQGALILRLGYILPSEEIDSLVEQFEASFSESTPSQVNRILFGRFPLEPYREEQFIPNNFRVFLVETELSQIRASPNHNQLCVVAISEQRGMIAFLFDSW